MKKDPKRIKILTAIVFIIIFTAINGIVHLQTLHHKNEERLKAAYTAEATVSRIKSQLDRYLSKSDLIKNIISSGYSIDDDQFSVLSELMQDNDNVIMSIQLAENGIITKVYPQMTNEKAVGMNVFENENSKNAAYLAKTNGEYAVAGPFELVQGKLGALILDPVYIDNPNGDEQFWGFATIVIDWEKFIESLELNKLDEAAYHYQIWKNGSSDGERIVIAQCQSSVQENALEVVCNVPNDKWYFDIIPINGWYSKKQLLINSILCMLLSALAAIVFLQFEMWRYRDTLHAEEMKRSADEARAANAAKTNFLARMSHDIRTPLNGIIGLLQINEKHPDDTALQNANRGKILVAANHLLELINDVLQMSKLESGEMVLEYKVLDLNQLAVDVLSIIEGRAAEEGITLEYDRNSEKVEFPFVYGSPLHLRQLFLNIYGNCIKYNKVGGKVRTEFRKVSVSDNTVTYRWVISDTGIGMSEEFLAHIFEPFAQEHTDARSSYSGSGLGMAIVKTLVDKMNGQITVTSKEGAGTSFTITLPFEIAESQPDEPKHNSSEAPSICGLHILLAEDNELNAEIAEVLLSDEGAIVTIVGDGEQAVNAFSDNPPDTFDAILMDIMMPVMDGITATKMIRETERPDAKDIPIIAMTANAFDEDVKKCLEAGMNAHLSKPINMDILISELSKICKKHSFNK